MSWPLSFLTAKRLPAQSGKYTASPSTVGVAETSPPVVNTHFVLRPLTLFGPIECSAGWLQVFARFCPAIGHWPDWDSGDWPCALKPAANETKKRILTSAVFAGQKPLIFLTIFIVLLNFVQLRTSLLRASPVAGMEKLRLLLEFETTFWVGFFGE